MPAPKANQFWRLRESHGRKPTFRKALDLWERCVEYFDWVEANPLLEEKAFASQGEVLTTNLSKMRAMTIVGLCLFLGIDRKTWRNYSKRTKGFVAITARVEDIIYEQKFTGASSGLLNPNIIARDLGLKDKQDINHSGTLQVNVIDSFEIKEGDSEGG